MIDEQISILKNHIEKCKKKGFFLLSNSQVSNFWIDINEFTTYEVMNSLIQVSAVILKNIYKKQGEFTVVIPKYNNSSEKFFPVDYIIESAISIGGLVREIRTVYVTQSNESGEFEISGSIVGFCVVVMAMSVHVVTLLKIIDLLENHGSKVDLVFNFICREMVSFKLLSERKISAFAIMYVLGLNDMPTTYNETIELEKNLLSSIECVNWLEE